MARFKYFKKVEHTILESAQASGLKRVEDNDEWGSKTVAEYDWTPVKEEKTTLW